MSHSILVESTCDHKEMVGDANTRCKAASIQCKTWTMSDYNESDYPRCVDRKLQVNGWTATADGRHYCPAHKLKGGAK